MKKNIRLLYVVCLIFLLPAPPALSSNDGLTKQQKKVAEGFVLALKHNDMKAAYELFSPSVRGMYRLDLFTDIQNNLQKTIGSPVSYKMRRSKSGNDAATACIYDMVYALGSTKTTIPLELTFDAADSQGRLSSFRYLKDQMKQVGR